MGPRQRTRAPNGLHHTLPVALYNHDHTDRFDVVLVRCQFETDVRPIYSVGLERTHAPCSRFQTHTRSTLSVQTHTRSIFSVSNRHTHRPLGFNCLFSYLKYVVSGEGFTFGRNLDVRTPSRPAGISPGRTSKLEAFASRRGQ